jgi:hypothetical protein
MLGVACDTADADGATLFVVDGAVLRPYLVYHLPVEYIHGIGTVRVGTQCCGRAVEHKRPWIVKDMLSDPLFADGRGGALASPIRSAFSVPVDGRAGGNCVPCMPLYAPAYSVGCRHPTQSGIRESVCHLASHSPSFVFR